MTGNRKSHSLEAYQCGTQYHDLGARNPSWFHQDTSTLHIHISISFSRLDRLNIIQSPSDYSYFLSIIFHSSLIGKILHHSFHDVHHSSFHSPYQLEHNFNLLSKSTLVSSYHPHSQFNPTNSSVFLTPTLSSSCILFIIYAITTIIWFELIEKKRNKPSLREETERERE